ncbi:MAG: sugar kinase [Elusimicrobia bacterium]|nr:sugar kinase [Elusimicrobiota bacterium]
MSRASPAERTAAAVESILVVTKRTMLEELVARFNSTAQARFYIEHAGLSFEETQAAHDAYARAVDALRKGLPRGVKTQFVERSFLPTFKFSGHDLVVTIGPDGLVINAAKYLTREPLLAVNPDPLRVDGILNPFAVAEVPSWVERAMTGPVPLKRVSMAKAELNDGQSLYGVNDLFIGVRSHVSARYKLAVGGRSEAQSSSGIIVSTGAGSTGWLSSVVNGAMGVARNLAVQGRKAAEGDGKRVAVRMPWDSDDLVYAVREPFASKTSQATLAFGTVPGGQSLVVESQMAENGIIFSDGIESDYLNFNAGVVATIRIAERKANLIARG